MGLPITITAAAGRYLISVDGLVIGDSQNAVTLHEAGRDPVLYVPRADMKMTLLRPTTRQSSCPWKGQASYFSVGAQENIIWSYERPFEAVAEIAGHLAFYPAVTVARV